MGKLRYIVGKAWESRLYFQFILISFVAPEGNKQWPQGTEAKERREGNRRKRRLWQIGNNRLCLAHCRKRSGREIQESSPGSGHLERAPGPLAGRGQAGQGRRGRTQAKAAGAGAGAGAGADDKKDIYEEMIRQHQELQRQTETRMQQLETETKQLQEQLATCHQATQRAQEEGEQLRGEKDRPISELRGRIDAMETEYEKILHGSLDREGRHRHAHGVQREAERVRTQSPGDLGP
nr:uncharacterized protein LOC102457822 [Pelodiscus sinensis]|eukprot:XP_025039730.1 uncharacterized protein LOC102457822 [Pelodiscus sinensis]